MKIRDKKKRILLIDDDLEDISMIEEILNKTNGYAQDFTLETARSLEAGLQHLLKSGADILLLDLNLPDSKGMETFLRVNKTAPDVPVVVMSVIYDDALAIEAVRKGAQDYLFKKETSPEVLVRTIRFSLERHSLRRELTKANARLERLAMIDPITELFNRRGLQEILSHEIQRAQKKNATLLALLVDLDDFKKINNALGHTVGDVVLKEVAAKLRASLRPTDYVGRVGGDEFMIFLPETLFAEGTRLAEKIRLSISTTVISMSSVDDLKITASIGLVNLSVMSIAESGDSINDMISKIHILLHKNKQSVKNKVSFDEAEVFYEHLTEIPEMLADGEKYRVLLQPILRVSDGVVTGYELLSRSSIKGFEMPDDFFRAALESNMLVKVDYQCLKFCVETAATLPSNLCYHVNVYPSTLINLPLENLIRLFSASKKKGHFCVEISEQQIIGDPSYLREAVLALKSAGIKIAIDDLGFGRSCLESIILLEPDIVKIDKKCVTGIAANTVAVKSLKRLLKMAKSLGAEVIAEGVESQADMELLQDLGVKYAQGYLLGKPQPFLTDAAKRAPKSYKKAG